MGFSAWKPFKCNDHNQQWVEEGLLIVRAILYNDDPKSTDEEMNRSSNALAFFRSPWRPKLQASQWLEIDTLFPSHSSDDQVGGFSGTALHAACFHGNLSTVHRLLSSSHSTGTPNTRGGIFGTPLQAAIIGQHIHIVEALLHAGADPNEDTYPGTSPIQTAVITNNTLHSIPRPPQRSPQSPLPLLQHSPPRSLPSRQIRNRRSPPKRRRKSRHPRRVLRYCATSGGLQ